MGSTTHCAAPSERTHEACARFGVAVACDKVLTKEIQSRGDVYILACKKPKTNPKPGDKDPYDYHVGVLATLDACTPHVEAHILDQWPRDTGWEWSSEAYARPYSVSDPANAIILKLYPGGDPTEEWGQLDLNCLKEVRTL